MSQSNIARARRILGQWGGARIRIAELDDELAWARGRLCCIRDPLRAQDLTGMPRSGGKTDISSIVVHVDEEEQAFAELERRISAQRAELIRLCCAVESAVDTLPQCHQQILRMWYRHGMSHLQISRACHYSVDRVKHIKSEADNMIAQRLI